MRWPDVLINSGKSHNQVKGNPESNLWPRYPAEESLDPHQTCFSGLTTMLSWGVTCLNSFLRHWPEPRRGQSSPSHSGVSDNSFCGVPGASDSYLSLLLLILSFHSMTDCFLPLTLFFILHIFTFLTQPDGEENTARYVGGERGACIWEVETLSSLFHGAGTQASARLWARDLSGPLGLFEASPQSWHHSQTEQGAGGG